MKVIISIVVFLLLLLVAFIIVAETFLRSTAEAEIAKDLKRYYNLEELPAVKIAGGPFFWRVMTGTFDSVQADMVGLDTSQFATGADRFASPMKIARMQIVLNGIRFSPTQILGGQKSFTAESGTLTAHVTEADLNAYMKNAGVKITFSIKPGEVTGQATLAGQGQTYPVTGKGLIVLQGNELIFDPVAVQGEGISSEVATNALRQRRSIPSIGGVRPTILILGDGELVLQADVAAFTFEPIVDEPAGSPASSSPSPTATASASASPSPSPSPTATKAPTKTPTKTPTKSTSRTPTKTPTAR